MSKKKKYLLEGQVFLDLAGNPYDLSTSKGRRYFYPGAKTVEEAQAVHSAWKRMVSASQEVAIIYRENASKKEREARPAAEEELKAATRDYERIKSIVQRGGA